MATQEIREMFKCSSGVNDTVTLFYYDHIGGDPTGYEGLGVHEDGLALLCSEEDDEYFTVYMTDQQVQDMATVLEYYLHRRRVNKEWEASK